MEERYELLREAGVRDNPRIQRPHRGRASRGLRTRERRRMGEAAEEASVHGVRHRRTRRPDDDQQGGRAFDRPDRPEGASRRNAPHPRDPANRRRTWSPALIKSNMPCRVSFKVASGMDSRIVLDQKGAELLLGMGDMMIVTPESTEIRRGQGTLVTDRETRQVAKFLKDRGRADLRTQSDEGQGGERRRRRRRGRRRRGTRSTLRSGGGDHDRDRSRFGLAPPATDGDRIQPGEPTRRPDGTRRNPERPQGFGSPGRS